MSDSLRPLSRTGLVRGAVRRGRPSSALVLAFGLLLAMAVLVANQMVARHEADEYLSQADKRGALLAFTFESHLSRTLLSINNNLENAAEVLQQLPQSHEVWRWKATDLAGFSRTLASSVRAATYLRSISLLDAQGKVLVSSNPSNVGLQVTWQQLGFRRELTPQLEVGGSMRGRDLADLVEQAGKDFSNTSIPMVKAMSTAGAPVLYLLAMAHPAYLLPDTGGVLEGQFNRVWLMDYEGQVLASQGNNGYRIGQIYPDSPVLALLRAEKEFGSYVASNLPGRPEEVFMVNFRAARTTPLAVGVELSRSHLLQQWEAGYGMLRWIGWLGSALILLATWALARAVKNQERAQQQMREAKVAAEQANAAKSQFLANMSHEIRTPINSMVGMTELALRTQLTDEQREYLTLAQSSSRQLLQLIDEILDFSRIEAGKLLLDPADFNLHRFCQEVFRSMSAQVGDKPLEVLLDLHPEVPKWVHGDAMRLRQVVTNLLGNAIKFTHQGSVRLGVALAGTATTGVTLRFEIQDTGIGIAPDKLNGIFGAFEQADLSTTRKFGGSGLGLAISSRLVKMMGGDIGVSSELGKGSQFFFSCHFQSAEARGFDALHSPVGQGAAPVIWLADASPLARSNLTKLLEVWDLLPRVIETEQALLAALQVPAPTPEGQITLLLLDSSLLGERVQEFLDHLKPPLASQLRVVLIHALADPMALQRKALGAKGWYFLAKPVTPSDLHTALSLAVLALQDDQRAVPPELIDGLRATGNPAHGPRVLLVEDTPLNQKLATFTLNKLGARVDLAENGQAALDALERAHYDLVLMDLQMPIMGGIEATQKIRIREQESGREAVPIVAMTAHGMQQDKTDCLQAGMNEFLVKPVAFVDFERVLNTYARRSIAEAGAASTIGAKSVAEE